MYSAIYSGTSLLTYSTDGALSNRSWLSYSLLRNSLPISSTEKYAPREHCCGVPQTILVAMIVFHVAIAKMTAAHILVEGGASTKCQLALSGRAIATTHQPAMANRHVSMLYSGESRGR